MWVPNYSQCQAAPQPNDMHGVGPYTYGGNLLWTCQWLRISQNT